MADKWGDVWRGQAAEPAVELDALRRRGSELSRRTRAEIVASVAAGALFAGVMGWRLSGTRGWIPAAAWLAVTVVWFIARRRNERPAESVTASGTEHYRRELERRRDHLRNVWIWHGPLIAACVTLAVVADSRMAMRQIGGMAPLLVVLVAWVVFGVVQRRRQARELQREIDELGD